MNKPAPKPDSQRPFWQTKSLAEIYAPMAGTIVRVNSALASSPEVRRATLFWNPDDGHCALNDGRAVPKGAQPILRFAEEDGSYRLFSVFPWRIEFPADVTLPFKERTAHTAFATLDGSRVAVRFSYRNHQVKLTEIEPK